MKKRIVPDYIDSIIPYSPGKPVEELERELGIRHSIKLASNENPLGPPKKAVKAICDAAGNINRYPDGGGYYLRKRLASIYKVDMDNIILGNGSNEIIELAVKAFLRPGEEAIVAHPTFLIYRMVVQAAGGKVITVPLRDNMTYNLNAMSEEIRPCTRIMFIANPNNPTGTIVSKEELEGFIYLLPKDLILLLDEAYCEYVRDPLYSDGLNYLDMGKRIIILRTFSKIYGLAGLRIGYGIADKEIIGYLNKVRQPFNINYLAQVGALAALEDREHIEKSKENNKRGIEFLFKEIEAMGLPCIPTQTNFFLVKVGDGRGMYEKLLYRGVIVRPMDGYGLKEYIRVTVGLPEENKRFIETLREILNKDSDFLTRIG